MHIILKPVGSSELDDIEITDSLFAVGRYEPPFSSYGRAKVAKLSKRHARIFEQDEQIYVADLGSTNGTVLNGKPIVKDPATARSGDEVSFGGLAYKIEFVGGRDQPDSDPGLRLVLRPERDQAILEPIVVSRFPFLINKYSEAFARYQEVLPDQLAFISRRHAHFFLRDGSLYIEDLDSTNGTFVGGDQLDEHARQLADGDTVAFGGDHFTYRVDIVSAAETERSLLTGDSTEAVEASDRTIYIDSPTSFVEIYVSTRDQDAIDDDEDQQADPEKDTRKGPVDRSRIGRSLSFVGQLKSAFLGDQGLSSPTRWVLRTMLAAVLAGAAYYYWGGRDLRDLEAELERSEFFEAAIRANQYLEEQPESAQWRKLATEALLKHVTPEWTRYIELEAFDEAEQLIASSEQLGAPNPDDDGLLAILGWATRVSRFLNQRGSGADINAMFEEGMVVADLVDWWEADIRVHARELVRLSSLASDFVHIREQIYGDVRELHALNREQRPLQEFRERLAAAFTDRNITDVQQAIDDFGGLDPRFRRLPPLDQDAQRMNVVFQALAGGRSVEAHRVLTERDFHTLPFVEHAAWMIGNVVPDNETVARYRAVAGAWREARTAEAFAGLDELASESWGAEAVALAARYQSLLDGYDTLVASRSLADHEERLFDYYALLDPEDDGFLVERLQKDFQAGAAAALERAGRYLETASATWSQYENLNGIGTEQRLENAISSAFRVRAKLLGDTHNALERCRQVFARIGATPGTGWKTLDAQVRREISLQRRSLANLTVVDPAVRSGKLELLPALPD